MGVARRWFIEIFGHHGVFCRLLHGRIHSILHRFDSYCRFGWPAGDQYEYVPAIEMGICDARQWDFDSGLWIAFGHCQSECKHTISGKSFSSVLLQSKYYKLIRLQERQFLFASILMEFLVSGSFYVLRAIYLEELSPGAIFLALFLRSQLTNTVTVGLVFLPKLWYQHKQVRSWDLFSVYRFFPYNFCCFISCWNYSFVVFDFVTVLCWTLCWRFSEMCVPIELKCGEAFEVDSIGQFLGRTWTANITSKSDHPCNR